MSTPHRKQTSEELEADEIDQLVQQAGGDGADDGQGWRPWTSGPLADVVNGEIDDDSLL